MKTMKLHYIWIFAALLFTGAIAVAAQGGSPNADEKTALEQFKNTLKGRIVWESNRTGAWELYVMNANGTGARRLTSLAAPDNPLAYQGYMRPRYSPDGRQILFAYGKLRAPAECWLADSVSGKAKMLTRGNPLNWLPDGSGFMFLRDKQIWRFDIAKGEETLALPLVINSADGGTDTVGYVIDDLSAGVFRFARNEYIRLSDGQIVKTTKGCEPHLTVDGRFMYWVQSHSDFRVWDIQADTELQILGTPPVEPFNYTYFPTVSGDYKWLMYGASPNQHDHYKSDYEIYIQRLDKWQASGKPVRLTFNTGTDRWPNLWIGRIKDLDGPYDVARNHATNPPPPPLNIASFASDGATPDWGGDSGLWPQVEGCGGESTWKGEDAESQTGGSMYLTYDIGAEPHGFSLWFAPERNIDLSAFDSFVLYARGNRPSFTFVVKDRTADAAGKTNIGIADLQVKGVTKTWQRFELHFDDFVPRAKGSTIDWQAINHAGVAIQAGRNAVSGTLQVDNIRATTTD